MSLKGRVALVTGGSRGIGRAISLALAADGAAVAVNYCRDEQAALQTADDINRGGGTARTYVASVDNFDHVEAMVALIHAELGPVSILINNAGIASRGLSVVDTDPAELRRVVSVDAFGSHYLSKLVVPEMRELPRGDIVMISSVASRGLAANSGPYNMAKAAKEALAVTLSREERPHGIRVNVVAPGLAETEMGRRLVRATAGITNMRTLDAQMPFGKVCQPEDIANVVRFLVSDSNAYITGETIYCDGRLIS